MVVAGGGRRGHDGIGGDGRPQVGGRRRGAGGRRQGQPLTTSTGLLAAPAVLLVLLGVLDLVLV